MTDLIQKHSEPIETRRNNMIRNLFDFLSDDCYDYIMTTLYPAFLDYKKEGKSFHAFYMHLTSEFITRIIKIYTKMNIENPQKLIADKYSEIVKNTIDTINREGHDFVVSFNKMKDYAVEYEILFLVKN
jgi:hypothetical protein